MLDSRQKHAAHGPILHVHIIQCSVTSDKCMSDLLCTKLPTLSHRDHAGKTGQVLRVLVAPEPHARNAVASGETVASCFLTSAARSTTLRALSDRQVRMML